MAAKKKATTKKTTRKRTTQKRATAKKGPTDGNVPGGTAYMEDVMPERAAIDMPGGVTPRATGSGSRAGVVSPGRRKYSAEYEMVDANTAMQRAIARQNGELPPIQGGLDDAQEDEMDDFDPLGEPVPGTQNYDPQPGDATLEAEEAKLAQLSQRHGVASAAVPVREVEFVQRPVSAPAPVEATTRVTLELQDGLMTMPAIKVLPETYGVTILLPLRDDGVTFIPKPGSSVTITHGENRWPCYFPGTHFTWDAMKCLGLVFVRADEER